MERRPKEPAETPEEGRVVTTATEPPGEAPGDYRVELEVYSGPLDLLLYLIRKDEVDIYDIPIARITERYLRYIELMSELDISVAGEFIVMAATLLEIKARMMAPEPAGEEEEEEQGDPRMELVRQLMEYRRFKEAALLLTERSAERGMRFGRPGERVNEKGERVTGAPRDVSVWVLLEAFLEVLEATGARGSHRVNLDAIPQAELNARLEAHVREAGRVEFFEVFEDRTDRIMLIGMFFAVLELARRQVIRAEQDELFGPIWLTYVPPDERADPETTDGREEVDAGSVKDLVSVTDQESGRGIQGVGDGGEPATGGEFGDAS